MDDMNDTAGWSGESAAIQSHLGIAQSVIQRMASNSAASKTWCISLVSAILVLAVDKSRSDYVLLAGIPTVFLCALDAYYLALERCFRRSYNSFIDKLHAAEVLASDLYVVAPTGSMAKTFVSSLGSWSVWPFYLALGVVICVARSALAQ